MKNRICSNSNKAIGRGCCIASLLLLISLTFISPRMVLAQGGGQSGVKPQVISLPSGPGSLEGLGESFEPDLSTGTASYPYPLAVPPGVNGFQPNLSLIYNGGNPNGAWGLGWKLNIPCIQRQTDKGLPDYTMADRFIFSSGEELVPIGDNIYRFENETSFMRFRWLPESESWQVHSPDGTLYEFGVDQSSRILVSHDGQEQIFRWSLTRQVDVHGNEIHYFYDRLDEGPTIYPSEVRYNFSSDDRYNAIKFTYEARPDIFADRTSRTAISYAFRGAHIDIWALDKFVRRYQLDYEAEASTKMHSLLSQITLVGDDGHSTLPPTYFTYTQFDPRAYAVVDMSDTPAVSLNDPNASLIDMTYDGLPDLVYTPSDFEQQLYTNIGHGRWNTTGQSAVGVAQLGSPAVKVADMNSDGQVDLLQQVSTTEVAYYATSPGQLWDVSDLVNYDTWLFPYFDVSDPQIQLVDMNNDKYIDILELGDSFYNIWLAPDNNIWSSAPDHTVDVLSQGLPQDTTQIRLADMTGDRLQDLVVIREGYLSYYPHKGEGNYDPERLPANAPTWLTTEEMASLILGDINNDGLADLVQPRSGQVRYWLNLGNDTFADYLTVPADGDTTTFMPELIPGQTSLQLADMNGDGSSDLVYGQPNGTIQYVDFNTGPQPNLLTAIDNGLGRTYQIDYEPSTTFYVADWEAGSPWQTTIPFPVQVVSRLTVLDANSGDAYITDFSYRDGYYDGQQKEFRGFAQAQQTAHGDETAPTTLTQFVYDTGVEDESRKGLLLEQTILGSGGACADTFSGCYQHQVNQITTRHLIDHSPDQRVTYSYVAETDTFIHEQQPDPIHLKQTFQQDDYGNVTQAFNYGQICDGDVTCGDDEVLQYTEYVTNLDAWILNSPVRAYQTDAEGNFVSESRYYYDGEPFVGLPQGQLTRGNLTRQEANLGPLADNRYIQTQRQEYDTYGNVVGMKDANGNLITVEYDALSHTFPVMERLHLAEGQTLSYAAAYHPGFGTVIAATDYNGHPATYTYDTFGRLSKIVLPGDTLAQPTQQFRYDLGSPRSSITTLLREHSGTDETLKSMAYFDGLGRPLQTRNEAEDGQVVVEAATTFNARQSVRDQFLPYFEASFAYAAPDPGLPRTRQHYDPQGRAIQTINPDQTFTRIDHHPLRQHLFDEEDVQPDSPHTDTPKILNFDGLERLVQVEETNIVNSTVETYTTRYGYDRLNNLIQLTDAEGNVKTMQYDGLSRKLQMDDPNRGVMTYAYDDNGNLIQTEDAKGQIIHRSYDAANRPLKEWWVDEHNQSVYNAIFHYDGNLSPHYPDAQNTQGQLAYAEDLAGAVYLSYDPRGNLTGQIRHFAAQDLTFVSRMRYDAMDRVTQLTYPDGSTVDYEYNERGLLERIPGYVNDLNYTASGQRDNIIYANGVRTDYDYDTRLRLAHLQSTSGQTALQDLTYTFDAANNILAINDGRSSKTPANDQSQTFGYDSLYRLTGVNGTYGQIDYAYNSIGNMVSKTSTATDSRLNLGVMGYGENGAGPHALTSAGGQTYRYDPNGNLSGKGDATYRWDPLDRLTAVVDDTTTSTYIYDSGGQRTHQIVQQGDTVTTTLYIDRYSELRGDELVHYIFADGQRVARRTTTFDPDRLLSGFADDATNPNVSTDDEWYVADHLGGTSLLLDASGHLLSEVGYYPYGLTRYEMNEGQVRYGFTGKELDTSGLYYYGVRYYDPELNRFTSVDSLYSEVPEKGLASSQSLNLYAYTINNPLRYVDPDGRDIWDVVDFVAKASNPAKLITDAAIDSVVEGYKEDGVTGAVNAVNPVYGALTSGYDSHQAFKRGDYGEGTLHGALALVNVVPAGRGVSPAARGAVRAGRGLWKGSIFNIASRLWKCSFIAGTEVSTIDGPKAIDTIEIGDLVLAYYEPLSRTGFYTVTNAYSSIHADIELLLIDGELIITTPEHPFYVNQGEWVPAGALRLGDRVHQADGDTGAIQFIWLIPFQQRMYNLTVADAHTFFVGDEQWLVHNACFVLPKTVRSARGVKGSFSMEDFTYRIDTNKVVPGEGGFHIHIFRNDDEIAKVTGRGGFNERHGGRILKKPSEIPKTVRKELNQLIRHTQKTLKAGEN